MYRDFLWRKQRKKGINGMSIYDGFGLSFSNSCLFIVAQERSHKLSYMVTREFKLSTIISLLSFGWSFFSASICCVLCATFSSLISYDCWSQDTAIEKWLAHQRDGKLTAKSCQYNRIKISFLYKFDMQWHLT